MNRFFQWLTQAKNIAPLATFRVVFGAMVFFSTCRFMALGWIEDHYTQPKFHFKYYGFEWVEAVSPTGLYIIHIIMVLAAVGIMLGAYYRLSAALFFLTFTYTELIDLTYYLNHYYFVSLTALLLIFLPAHHAFSIDSWRKPTLRQNTTPQYFILLLKFQIFIVYFYAGLAKINATWLLDALPLKIWLPAHDTLPVIGFLLQKPATAYVFSWAGMLFDTFVIFFLAYRPTRILAYLAIVFFHAMTGLLFQIGVFPLVMIGATLIFFSDAWHERWQKGLTYFFTKNINRVKKGVWKGKNASNTVTPERDEAKGIKGVVEVADLAVGIHINLRREKGGNAFYLDLVLVTLWVVFQVVFPWRYLFYDGNMFWTEEGYRFGWRVMLMEKAGTATFFVKDSQTGREGEVLNSDFLNPHQEKQMAMQPDMILQYAHFLKKHYEKGKSSPVSVRAEVWITLNGKPSQLYFDPQLDLTTIKDSWQPKTWLYESKFIEKE